MVFWLANVKLKIREYINILLGKGVSHGGTGAILNLMYMYTLAN